MTPRFPTLRKIANFPPGPGGDVRRFVREDAKLGLGHRDACAREMDIPEVSYGLVSKGKESGGGVLGSNPGKSLLIRPLRGGDANLKSVKRKSNIPRKQVLSECEQ